MNSGVFFLRKTSTVHISNFCSGTPLRKVHELTFLWFGLPGPLLRKAPDALNLVDVSDMFFIIFGLGEGKGESRATGTAGGSVFY